MALSKIQNFLAAVLLLVLEHLFLPCSSSASDVFDVVIRKH